MKGSIIFFTVFFTMFAATLTYPGMPPGRQIYGSLGVPETDYPVIGILATTLVVAVFNGVVYGITAWLIFTITEKARKP